MGAILPKYLNSPIVEGLLAGNANFGRPIGLAGEIYFLGWGKKDGINFFLQLNDGIPFSWMGGLCKR